MSNVTRRSLMAGAAATGALVATAAAAQDNMVPVSYNMQGLPILITGCSSGFGRLMAETFARSGAKVFATMRNLPRAEASELAAIAKKDGLDITILPLDVLDEEQVNKTVAEAERLAGGAMEVVINNAGISFGGPIEIQDLEATQLTFDTNVFGPHRVARAALPKMRAAKKGLIVNVTSQLGRVIVPAYGQYSPTKFALEAMSEAMAYELAPHGIDVTIIQPGGYPTNIWKNANTNSTALLARADEKHTSGYPELIAQLGNRTGGGTTDPMDVPKAILEVIFTRAGSRPLRKEVHPGAKPQIAINKVAADVQVGWLGKSPYGPWIKSVHNV